MIKWKNLFDRQIVKIYDPEPQFVPLDCDKSRRDFLGYSVRVQYKNHSKERLFALKKATNQVKKGHIDDAKRRKEAEKRAWAYKAKMCEKM